MAKRKTPSVRKSTMLKDYDFKAMLSEWQKSKEDVLNSSLERSTLHMPKRTISY